MGNKDERHQLILYQYILDRWWRIIFYISLVLFMISGGLGGLPILFPHIPFMWASDWKLWVLAGAGGCAFIFCFFLVAVRKKAYVQTFDDYLHIKTPFFRMNISFTRFRKTYTSEIQQIFPPNRVNRWQREFLFPLNKYTAVVLDLSGLPFSRGTLKFFLSPLFFPDKASTLVLLVPDWIRLSTELESRRSSFKGAPRLQLEENPKSRILHEISRHKN